MEVVVLLLITFAIACVILWLSRDRREGYRQGWLVQTLMSGTKTVTLRKGTGSDAPKSWTQDLWFGARDDAFVTFQIRVHPGFEFGCRGKVGGFLIGPGASSDGQHSADGASFRIMWNAAGGLYMYLYVPYGSQPYQKWARLREWPRQGDTGIPMFDAGWPKGLVPVGETKAVAMGVRLNSLANVGGRWVPRADGAVYLRVNGVEHTLGNVVLRMRPDIRLTRFRFQPFHGGPCKATRDSTLTVSNVQLFAWIP